MPVGDHLLDSDGYRQVDPDGYRVVDDGAGNACPANCGCTTATYCYYRFKKCSDSTDSAYWMRGSSVVSPETCPTLTRGWVFQTEDGTCYYVTAGQSGTTDDHSADQLPIPNTEIETCALCPVVFWECFGCPDGCVITSITFNLAGGADGYCCPPAADGPTDFHQEFTRNPFEGSFELVRYSNAVGKECCFRYKQNVEPFTRTYWDEFATATGCTGTAEDPTLSKIMLTTCDVLFAGGGWWVEYPFPSASGFANPFSMTDYAGSVVAIPDNSGCTSPATFDNPEPTGASGDPADCSPSGGISTATLHMDCDEEPPP